MFFQRNSPFQAGVPAFGSASNGHFYLLAMVAVVVPLYLIAILLTGGPTVRLWKQSSKDPQALGNRLALLATAKWLVIAGYLELTSVLELMGSGASNTMANWIGWPFLALTLFTLLAILVSAWERGAPRRQTDDLKRIADAAEALAGTRELPTPEQPGSESEEQPESEE
jgi:hypothetical protein